MKRFKWYTIYVYLEFSSYAQLKLEKPRDDYCIMYEILMA